MIKKIITLFIFIPSSFGCIVTPPKTLVISKNPNRAELKKSFIFKECPSSQSQKLMELVSDFKGVLNKRTLGVEVPGLTLTRDLTIHRLEDFINDRLNTPKDWRITNPKFTHANQTVIALGTKDTLSLECNHCNQTGTKTLKGLVINPIEGTQRSIWLKGDLAVKTQSLILKRTLHVSNKPLKPNQFYSKTIYSKNPDRLFTNKNQLVFYKLNKGKSKGEAIMYQDITPVNLVTVGQPVTILLKNNSLLLEGKATPHQSGKLGQVIRLKNNRTNKTVIGKIVDFNKVEVQL